MSGRHTKSPSGTPAIDLLHSTGTAFTSHEFDHDRDAASFGLEAAEALGVGPDRIFKTLVAQTDRPTDRGLVVAVVPADRQLDLKSLARELGCKRATLADPTVAQQATGYLIGGISPLAQKRTLVTVLDASVNAHRTVLVSGGRRGLDVEISPADLAKLTGAQIAPIAR